MFARRATRGESPVAGVDDDLGGSPRQIASGGLGGVLADETASSSGPGPSSVRAAPPAATASPDRRTPLNFVICVGGVIASLSAYGVLQERLMTQPYDGENGPETFTHSVFLVLVNRVATVVVAGCGLALTGGSFAAGSRQLLVAYAVVACSNWTTTVCQYEVLKYLSFAASTLTKCAKILPVMAWGRVVLRKRYGSADVAVAVAVTFGCFLFAMDRGVLRTSPTVGGATKKHDDAFAAFDDGNGGKGNRRGGGAREDVVVKAADAHESAKAIAKARRAKTRAAAAASAAAIAASGAASAKDDEMIVTGAVIILVYLACDGFTSTTQQWLFRRHATPVLSQIFFTTCFACVFSFAWLSSTSQLGEAIGFVTRHPRALQDVFVLAVSACAAQFAINYTIYCFGAVTLASVMTFRQFLAVVLSCFAFGTPLTGAQWFALVLILAPVMKRIDSGAIGRYFAPESDGGGTRREKDVEGGRGASWSAPRAFFR